MVEVLLELPDFEVVVGVFVPVPAVPPVAPGTPAEGAPNPAVSVTRAVSPLLSEEPCVGSSKVIVTLFPETFAIVPVILVPPKPPVAPAPPAPPARPAPAPPPANPAKPDPPSALRSDAPFVVVEDVAE